jgi:4'-phosphopantetheinyl transferase EntD
MIERALPAVVASADAFGDRQDAMLYPEEALAVARSSERRRREYATARSCARAALAELGIPPAPILAGERRAPQWPPEIVGSITHCCGYRAAAVARSADVHALGIDAEPNAALPDGVLDYISGAGERALLAELAVTRPDVCWDRLLFSAKESCYKAWFPLSRTWLGFTDVAVIPSADGSFDVSLLSSAPIGRGFARRQLSGKWLVQDGFVVTAIAEPVPARTLA